MPIQIEMPKLSDTMEEGTVLQWRIKQGDRVKRGDIIAEVETDKAAMEMEAYEDGVVKAIKVAEGETVPVGTVLAVLEAEGGAEEAEAEEEEVEEKEQPEEPAEVDEAAEPREDEDAEAGEDTESETESARQRKSEPEKKTEAEKAEKEQGAPAQARQRIREGRRAGAASPAARKLAGDLGIDLAQLRGTGPGGRVVLADVEQMSRSQGLTAEPPAGIPSLPTGRERSGEKSVKIRRIMARKMTESWQTIPHFYVTYAVDMTDIIRFRKDLGLTINDFIMAGVARSIKEHPWINSWWIDGEAVEKAEINLALAVATERGLYNPVIHGCESLTLREISKRSHAQVQKAHQAKLTPEDLDGGTFTISNMGMLGVETFRAIITPPQAAVLAVGTVKGEVIVDESGEPAVAPVMRMTLAADHRILDGADAAEFMATLKSYLEAPVTLISCELREDD